AARSRREVARAERFVVAPIKIDLPPLECATGICDLPAGAAENCADRVVERGQLGAIHKTVFAFSSRGGSARHQDVCASANGLRGKPIDAATITSNVAQAVLRRDDAA